MPKAPGSRLVEFLFVAGFFSATAYVCFTFYQQSLDSGNRVILHIIGTILCAISPFYFAWMVLGMYRRKAMRIHLKKNGKEVNSSDCIVERLDNVFGSGGMPYYRIHYTFVDNNNKFERVNKLTKYLVDKYDTKKELKDKQLTILYDPEHPSWNLWKVELNNTL